MRSVHYVLISTLHFKMIVAPTNERTIKFKIVMPRLGSNVWVHWAKITPEEYKLSFRSLSSSIDIHIWRALIRINSLIAGSYVRPRSIGFQIWLPETAWNFKSMLSIERLCSSWKVARENFLRDMEAGIYLFSEKANQPLVKLPLKEGGSEEWTEERIFSAPSSEQCTSVCFSTQPLSKCAQVAKTFLNITYSVTMTIEFQA